MKKWKGTEEQERNRTTGKERNRIEEQEGYKTIRDKIGTGQTFKKSAIS